MTHLEYHEDNSIAISDRCHYRWQLLKGAHGFNNAIRADSFYRTAPRLLFHTLLNQLLAGI